MRCKISEVWLRDWRAMSMSMSLVPHAESQRVAFMKPDYKLCVGCPSFAPWSHLLIALTSVQRSDRWFSTWWWHWHWLLIRKSEERPTPHRADSLIPHSPSVSHPHGSTRLHTHTHTHPQATTVTGVKIMIVSLVPVSLTSWQLNPHWNIVSGMIVSTFFSSLWRWWTYHMMSPVSLGLISHIENIYFHPSGSTAVMNGWILKALGQMFAVAALSEQRFVWPMPPLGPLHGRVLFVHLSLRQPLAVRRLSPAADAKPGSHSELKVAARCSFVCPSWPTFCLDGWLDDWTGWLSWIGSWLTSLIGHVFAPAL